MAPSTPPSDPNGSPDDLHNYPVRPHSPTIRGRPTNISQSSSRFTFPAPSTSRSLSRSSSPAPSRNASRSSSPHPLQIAPPPNLRPSGPFIANTASTSTPAYKVSKAKTNPLTKPVNGASLGAGLLATARRYLPRRAKMTSAQTMRGNHAHFAEFVNPVRTRKTPAAGHGKVLPMPTMYGLPPGARAGTKKVESLPVAPVPSPTVSAIASTTLPIGPIVAASATARVSTPTLPTLASPIPPTPIQVALPAPRLAQGEFGARSESGAYPMPAANRPPSLTPSLIPSLLSGDTGSIASGITSSDSLYGLTPSVATASQSPVNSFPARAAVVELPADLGDPDAMIRSISPSMSPSDAQKTLIAAEKIRAAQEGRLIHGVGLPPGFVVPPPPPAARFAAAALAGLMPAIGSVSTPATVSTTYTGTSSASNPGTYTEVTSVVTPALSRGAYTTTLGCPPGTVRIVQGSSAGSTSTSGSASPPVWGSGPFLPGNQQMLAPAPSALGGSPSPSGITSVVGTSVGEGITRLFSTSSSPPRPLPGPATGGVTSTVVPTPLIGYLATPQQTPQLGVGLAGQIIGPHTSHELAQAIIAAGGDGTGCVAPVTAVPSPPKLPGPAMFNGQPVSDETAAAMLALVAQDREHISEPVRLNRRMCGVEMTASSCQSEDIIDRDVDEDEYSSHDGRERLREFARRPNGLRFITPPYLDRKRGNRWWWICCNCSMPRIQGITYNSPHHEYCRRCITHPRDCRSCPLVAFMAGDIKCRFREDVRDLGEWDIPPVDMVAVRAAEARRSVATGMERAVPPYLGLNRMNKWWWICLACRRTEPEPNLVHNVHTRDKCMDCGHRQDDRDPLIAYVAKKKVSFEEWASRSDVPWNRGV